MFSLSVVESNRMPIEPNRVIEINRLGRFYVIGKPTYVVVYAPDFLNPERNGWIIVDESASGFDGTAIIMANKLYKMTKDNKLIPALFKNEEMAHTVCYACNRIRV